MARKKRDDNFGNLYKNMYKTIDWHAPYRGKAKIDGKDYYVDAFVKESPSGKYFYMTYKLIEPKAAEGGGSAAAVPPPEPRKKKAKDDSII